MHVVKTHSYTVKRAIFDPDSIDQSSEEFNDQNVIEKGMPVKNFQKVL